MNKEFYEKNAVQEYLDGLTAMDKLEMLSLVANLDKPEISDRDRQAVLLTTFIADDEDLQDILSECGVSCSKEDFFEKFLTDDDFYNAMSSTDGFAEIINLFAGWAEYIKENIDVRRDLNCGEELVTEDSSILNPFKGVNPTDEEGLFAYVFDDQEKIDEFNANVLPSIAAAMGVDRLNVGTNKKGHILYRNDSARRGDFRKKKHLLSSQVDAKLNFIRDKKDQYKRICKIVGRNAVDECMDITKEDKRKVYVQESYVERISQLIYDIALSEFEKKNGFMKRFSQEALVYFAKAEGVTDDVTPNDFGYTRMLATLYATKYILKYIDFDKYATVGSSQAVMDKLDADIALVVSKNDYKPYVMYAAHETAKQIAKEFFNNSEISLESISQLYTGENTVGQINSIGEAMFRTLYDPAEAEILAMVDRENERRKAREADRIADVEANEEEIIEEVENPIDEPTDEEEIVEEEVAEKSSVLPEGFIAPSKEEIDAYLAKKRAKEVTGLREQEDETERNGAGDGMATGLRAPEEDVVAEEKDTEKREYIAPAKTEEDSTKAEEDLREQVRQDLAAEEAKLPLVSYTKFYDDIISKFADVLYRCAANENGKVINEEAKVAYERSMGKYIDTSFMTEEDAEVLKYAALECPDNKFTRLLDRYVENAKDLRNLFNADEEAVAKVVAPYAKTIVQQFESACKDLALNKVVGKKAVQGSYTYLDMESMVKEATKSTLSGAIKSFESSKANKYSESEKYKKDYNTIANRISASLKLAQQYLGLSESERAEFKANEENKSVYNAIVEFEEKTLKEIKEKFAGRTIIGETSKAKIISEYRKALHSLLGVKLKNQAKGIFAHIQSSKKADLADTIATKIKDGMLEMATEFEAEGADKSIVKELRKFGNKYIDANYFFNADKKIAENNNLSNDICNKCKFFMESLIEIHYKEDNYKYSKELQEAIAEQLAKIKEYVKKISIAKEKEKQQ